MRAVVVGAGAVGMRAARQLHSTDGLESLAVADKDDSKAASTVSSLGAPARVVPHGAAAADGADVVVIASSGDHRPMAEAALERGAHVVSVAGGLDAVRDLLDLDAEARERGLTIAVGAGFAPGLSDLLARHAAVTFDVVDEVHVSSFGTGGPACARERHDALGGQVTEWRDGAWVHVAAGSGRELCFFPDPVLGVDCYRAALGTPLLLAPAFPGVVRVTARIAASRGERLTGRLPMLRKPRAEGTTGAVRVEVRGRRGEERVTRVLGAIDRAALAAGTVAAVIAARAADGRLARTGAAGLAELVDDPIAVLRELADRGVKAAVFDGDNAPA